MNLAELIFVLFALFVLALAGARTLQARDEAELSRDVEAVRAVALQYVKLKCSSLPLTAVTLPRALAQLGLITEVRHPARWRILLTARPGQTGPATSLQYWIRADTWQWVYLLDTYPAIARTGYVRLNLHRKPGAPNRRGFQGLLEGTLC